MYTSRVPWLLSDTASHLISFTLIILFVIKTAYHHKTPRILLKLIVIIDSLLSRLMLVVLQVRLVLPNVTRNSDNKSQVEQRLAGSILTIEVGSLVLAPWSGWLLWSRSWSSWQLLVEGDNLAHSLGVSSATNVLWVSKMVVEECGEFEVVNGAFVCLDS